MWFSERAAPTSWSRRQPANMPSASVTTTGSSAPRMMPIMALALCLRPAASSARSQHAIDHGAGQAEIAGRIGQLLDFVGAEPGRDLRVLSQQVGKRGLLVARLVDQLVDEVMRPIAAELG